MDLSILDRIVIFDALQGYAPKMGNALTMRSVKSLLESIPFEEGEVKEHGITFDAEKSNYQWNAIDYRREFDFTDGELTILRKVAKALDGDGRMQIGFLDTYDRIMATEPVAETENVDG